MPCAKTPWRKRVGGPLRAATRGARRGESNRPRVGDESDETGALGDAVKAWPAGSPRDLAGGREAIRGRGFAREGLRASSATAAPATSLPIRCGSSGGASSTLATKRSDKQNPSARGAGPTDRPEISAHVSSRAGSRQLGLSTGDNQSGDQAWQCAERAMEAVIATPATERAQLEAAPAAPAGGRGTATRAGARARSDAAAGKGQRSAGIAGGHGGRARGGPSPGVWARAHGHGVDQIAGFDRGSRARATHGDCRGPGLTEAMRAPRCRPSQARRARL